MCIANSPKSSFDYTMKRKYTGEVVYMYAFDVAYEIDRQSIKEIMGQPTAQFVVDSGKRNPRQLFFYRPQMIRLPSSERIGPHGPVRIEYTAKFLSIGAMSITAKVPFSVDKIEDLIAYHDLSFSNGSLHDEVLRIAEEIRLALEPHSTRILERLADEEAYTVFCISASSIAEGDASPVAGKWWEKNRPSVAALLTQESDIEHLSSQEAEESTDRYLSYYEKDLLVIDWDSALLVDEPKNFDESLYVLELANLQLAELEAYDRMLDDALERAYRDLRSQPYKSRHILKDMREIRIDLTRMNDELSNITKFFGDWHLARIYQNVSARFHLSDWSQNIGTKLKTLDNLYEMLHHDRMNRMMLVLEITIVLLFVIDLVVLAGGLK